MTTAIVRCFEPAYRSRKCDHGILLMHWQRCEACEELICQTCDVWHDGDICPRDIDAPFWNQLDATYDIWKDEL